jgi:hypothetical protein
VRGQRLGPRFTDREPVHGDAATPPVLDRFDAGYALESDSPAASGVTPLVEHEHMPDEGDQGNLMDADPVILQSARKHRVSDDEMMHAYRHPIRMFDLDDLTILIGPDPSGRLLEVGAATAEGTEFIVHAMPARAKFPEM